MTSISKPVENVIASKDRAETFAESEVSLTLDKIKVGSESLKLGLLEGTTASRQPDDTQNSATGRSGVRINPNTALEGVKASYSANTSGVTTAYLILESDNSILDQTDISDLSSSDEFTLLANLSADTRYKVVVDAGGSSYTSGAYNTPNFPYTSTDVDIINSFLEGGGRINAFDAISDVTALAGDADSGSAYIEWARPADVYRWDAATFTATEDGETVDVYIEESSDGGATWTEIAGPIARGQDIPAAPDSRCRFRVELSRSDTTNSPSLDSIYRRWVV